MFCIDLRDDLFNVWHWLTRNIVKYFMMIRASLCARVMFFVDWRKTEQAQVFGTALNMKLLMDMPEKVSIYYLL